MNAMQPALLQVESFRAYPPQARALMLQNIEVLRRLPLILVPLILREAITYDWRFPAERSDLEGQLSYLNALAPDSLSVLMAAFNRLTIAEDLEKCNWIDTPSVFIEQLTAHLWATHQMDAFHTAAAEYAAAWQAAKPAPEQDLARLAIVVIGQGAIPGGEPVFRKLRPHGVYFSSLSPEDGLHTLLDAVSARVANRPGAYRHWYIDGGSLERIGSGITSVSYASLEPARTTLLSKMQQVIQSGSSGPEALRTLLAQMKPESIGLPASGDAPVNYFQLSVLTEGSGTQIFSTTFVQWAAREALRRAQPVTLLARFAPRQRQQPMNELLSGAHSSVLLDPQGSLVDADMAAYYTWLNLQRLPGADKANFIAWFEGQTQAVAIGPSLPRGTVSSAPTTLQQILQWIA